MFKTGRGAHSEQMWKAWAGDRRHWRASCLGKIGTLVDRLAVRGGNEEMRQEEVISGIVSLAICRQRAGTETVKRGIVTWLNLQFK